MISSFRKKTDVKQMENMGVPYMVVPKYLFHGKSENNMDDNWGYVHDLGLTFLGSPAQKKNGYD